MTTLTLVGPTLAAVLMLGGWMLAGSRDDQHQPRRAYVALGEWLAIIGTLLALVTLPTDLPPSTYAVALAATVLAGLVLVRGAGRLAQGWTTAAEVVTSAVWLGWTRPQRVVWSTLAALAGLGLAVWLADQGSPWAGLLGALMAIAPARWHLPAGFGREQNRTGVEIATAGTWRGAEWDSHEAERRSSPIRVRFRGDEQPCLVTAPLPPSWRASALEADRAELRERLSAWGSPWAVEMDPSSRRLRARLCEPLPTRWVIPSDRSWEWIGKHKPSALALYLGEAQDADTGEAFPLWWDPDATDPHALIGGKTKSGKSVGLRLLVAQAVARGWGVIIADPKGVDFVWAGRLPGVRYFPGVNCLDGLAEAVGEMQERQGWLQRSLWTGAAGADEEGDLLKVPGQPYQPCLVIVDEAAEIAGLGDKDDKAQTAERLSSLARLSRFVGMICAFATQRPDVKFLSGETKANLGTRVLYGSAGPTLTNMVLDMASRDLAKLTAGVRGRGRAVITEGTALEFQGGFITPRTVKGLRGVLDDDNLPKVRFAEEPEWRRWVRAGKAAEAMDPAALKHPDYDRVAADLDAKMAEADAAAEGEEDGKQSDHAEPGTEDKPRPERGRKKRQDRDDAEGGIEESPAPGSGSDPAPDDDSPDPADEIDPLDFWEED